MRQAFYVVSDALHFVGTAALLNSLRLVGHEDPLVVVDAGLEPRQRTLLEQHATLVESDSMRDPSLVKWDGPLREPADVMVVVDADVVAVSSLAPVLELAAEGRVVAFADERPERFHGTGWADALGVDGLERGTYVNCGLIALPRRPGEAVLATVRELQLSIDLGRSRGRSGATLADPFYFPDQDSWNAVLAATPGARPLALERGLAPAPPFEGLELVDGRTLDCRYRDGSRPYLLHHWGPKPWLGRTIPNVYSRLLRRLLTAEDVALRVPASWLPLRYRGRLLRWPDRCAYAAFRRGRDRARRARARLASGA